MCHLQANLLKFLVIFINCKAYCCILACVTVMFTGTIVHDSFQNCSKSYLINQYSSCWYAFLHSIFTSVLLHNQRLPVYFVSIIVELVTCELVFYHLSVLLHNCWLPVLSALLYYYWLPVHLTSSVSIIAYPLVTSVLCLHHCEIVGFQCIQCNPYYCTTAFYVCVPKDNQCISVSQNLVTNIFCQHYCAFVYISTCVFCTE